MRITIARNEQKFFSLVAWRIVAQIVARPESVIGLSTGRTTGGVHKALARIHDAHPFDTSRVTVFNLDEVTGVSRDYFGSCYYMILHEVILPLGIPMKNFIMPPTRSADWQKECTDFESAIEDRGGIDLQVLGIGENGHLGFNQPGTPFGQGTWLSRMDGDLDARIRRETGSSPEADLGGITIGIRTIMRSRRIVLVANGARKAAIVKAAVQGPVEPSVPASVLQLHPYCEAILDPAAAAALSPERPQGA